MATLPLPGLLTKKNADYQQQRMLAVSFRALGQPLLIAQTDARVDSITEAVNSVSGSLCRGHPIDMSVANAQDVRMGR